MSAWFIYIRHLLQHRLHEHDEVALLLLLLLLLLRVERGRDGGLRVVVRAHDADGVGDGDVISSGGSTLPQERSLISQPVE